MTRSKQKLLIIVTTLILVLILTGCSESPAPEVPEAPNPPAADNSDEDTSQPRDKDNNEEENKKNDQLLEMIVELAKQGKVLDCPFAAGQTVFDDVEEEWGKADNTDYVASAKGTYATYSSRGYVFGINKGYQVFEVRSFGKKIKDITLSHVKEVLGDPDKVLDYPGQDILGYNAGTDYKLEFVFPEPSEEDNHDPSLDHYNVLYPPGTVNMMADDPGRQW